jgi:transposase
MDQSNVLVKNGKRIPVGVEDDVFVGLDVHAKKVNVAVRINGEQVARWVSPPGSGTIVRSLRPLRRGLCKVAYEAGPTGYGLYRALRAEGLPVEVWAPGKMPRPANRSNKTDRKDAATLAEYAQKDLGAPISVPTPQQEADRQVMRTRNQLVEKARRVKQQIRSFLLMHGLRAPAGLGGWSRAAVGALRRLSLGAELKCCMDALVDELTYLQGLKKRLEQKLRQLARTDRHAAAERLLRTHPGVGPLSAMGFLLEIYRPERFEADRQLSTYLGLVPRVSQSADRRTEGPLIRSGQSALRSMLVQAAWQWVRRDGEGKAIFQRILSNTQCAQKAIVAVARHMSVNLWYMLLRGEPYRPPEPPGPGRKPDHKNSKGERHR